VAEKKVRIPLGVKIIAWTFILQGSGWVATFLFELFKGYKDGPVAIIAIIALGIIPACCFIWVGINFLRLYRWTYSVAKLMIWFGLLLWMGAAFALLWEPRYHFAARIFFIWGIGISLTLLCLIYSANVRIAFSDPSS
jgi:hypothetical protein